MASCTILCFNTSCSRVPTENVRSESPNVEKMSDSYSDEFLAYFKGGLLSKSGASSEYVDGIYRCSYPDVSPVVIDVALTEESATTSEAYVLAQCSGVESCPFIFTFEMINDSKYAFCWSNIDNEPIAFGVYDADAGTFRIVEVLDNSPITKAIGGGKAERWVCNLGIGMSGTIWSFALGMVNPILGMATSVAFTVLTTSVCP